MSDPSPIQTQVFTLSWLASQAPTGQPYPAGGSTGDDSLTPWGPKELQDAIDSLNDTIPSWGWDVVWGPGYAADWGGEQGKPSGEANAMFVVRQRGSGDPLYVIAIAGTNTASKFDGIEDLDTTPWSWNLKNPGNLKPQVTHGDWSGLANLLGISKNGSKILGVVQGIPDKDSTTLWFTGHSLGGALSPMLMLALMDPDTDPKAVDTSQTQLGLWKQVNLLATAGPSIGNQDFVTHFQQVFGAHNASTTFIWNGNDVVPHAWNYDTMMALTQPTNIYGIDLPPNGCAASKLASAQNNATGSGKNYVMFEPTPAFTFDLQEYTDPDAWTPDAKFFTQLGFQHLNAYVSYFGCSEWFPLPDAFGDPEQANAAAATLCSQSKDKRTLAAAPPELSAVG
jgi:hypothetical protein